MAALSWRTVFSPLSFWLVIAAIGIFLLTPLRKSLRFGIDLVGGTYITLEVQTEKAIESELASTMESMEARLQRMGKVLPTKKMIDDGEIILIFSTVQQAQDAMRIIVSDNKDLSSQSNGQEIRFRFTSNKEARIKDDSVTRNIQILKTRFDKLADILVARQGERNIIVELPDVDDPQQAKEMIGRAAQLDFRLVERQGSTKEDLLYELDGYVPHDKEILEYVDNQRGQSSYCLVSKYARVTGKMLKDARPMMGGQTGVEPVVAFDFNDEGAERFYDLTNNNIGRPLAIVLDNEIIKVATIQTGIRDTGTITGMQSPEVAKTLAKLLKSGSFTAPVTFEEERQIGPSLGQESIEKGLHSCLIGLLILFFFSLFYYKVAGLFAFLALLFNLILVLMGLAWFGATLTLPGIAGMILTVGMAIDASILIFERIKEELKEGVSIRKAVNTGFSNALRVILDANVTTFIVGVVLYQFGTGPIQGFAVTMMMGIIATLIASLFFLRSLFSFVLDNFGVRSLKI